MPPGAIKDRQQAAEHIAAEAARLAALARRFGLDGLGYMLEMAAIEAEEQVALKRKTPPALSR